MKKIAFKIASYNKVPPSKFFFFGRFQINLKTGLSDNQDNAFHFNPRMNAVVLNSYRNGGYEKEETHRCPFVKGGAFDIIMVIKPECYEVGYYGEIKLRC